MQGPKWPIILLACGPGVVIVNCLGQVVSRPDSRSDPIGESEPSSGC